MIQKFDGCTGCRACEHVCPTKCIQFELDRDGFIYPKVNMNKCIGCLLCENVCHVSVKKEKLNYENKNTTAYYGWHSNEEIRKISSSGGAFTAIVEKFLDEGDIVFGSSYNDDFYFVSHIECNKESYAKLRKSKYVFSDLLNCYTKAKKYLEMGKKVLFTGTPCQIGGLKKYLNYDYENLLTVDFICHGTPSTQLYQQHLNYITSGIKVKKVDFRSKAYGWMTYCLKIDLEEGNYLKKLDEDYYMYHFLNNYTLRKCCYSCNYSDKKHVSDITIADFWGISKYKPELIDEKGISLIIFNNNKGRELLNLIKEVMKIWPIEEKYYKYVYKTHDNYNQANRDKFLNRINKVGYNKAANSFKYIMVLKNIKKQLRCLLFNK